MHSQGRVLLLMPRELYIVSRFMAVCATHGVDCALLLHDREAFVWRLVTYRDGEYVSVCNSTGESFEELVSLLSRDRYLGVVPTGEFSAQQAEYLAYALGLFHNPIFTVSTYRNKYEMRQLFDEHGIIQPKILARFFDISDVDEFDWSSVTFPIIAKPIDLTSSLYVRLCHTMQEARGIFRKIFTHTQSFGGITFLGQGLLETYCGSPEFSAECVVADGRVLNVYITTKFVSPLPACDEIGHISGALVDQRHQFAARQLAEAVAAAWNTIAGVLHIEYKFDGTNVILMEAACRIGGDHISELIELQYGFCLESALIKSRCSSLNILIPHCIVSDYYHGIRFIFSNSNSDVIPDICVLRKVWYHKRSIKSNGYGIGERLGYELLRSKSLKKLISYIGQDNVENAHNNFGPIG